MLETTSSLASSVRDYTYENGRRYHAYRHGQYPMPNDEQEQDRQELFHHICRLLTGGEMFRAPITAAGTPLPSAQRIRILDMGTGTGLWPMDMAEDFPQAEILGTDLSPIQPVFVPPNCRFYVDDLESEWTYPPAEAFDYIHGRSLAGGIADWPKLVGQAYTHLNPGGWFELQEFEARITSDDGTHLQSPLLREWLDKLEFSSQKFGKPVMNVAANLASMMHQAGFVNITNEIYKCPIGSWPKNPRLKEIGQVAKLALLEAVESYSLALFTRVLGQSAEEALEFVSRVRSEILRNTYHMYVRFYYVYGQRPE
ncbi:hypothetical protein ASPZODRAFT_2106358 [Penicilliopsis zonata CBS 506.65]|uniref:Methyltransferase domain-containing protein n=1 Tax=Penicilliopsis zonata CBS 506.65 TaxID=1073090 RepID=A0A1L9SVN2_9EURO|nr:hypothetical protein ASPZODRAFT_2106358 [Penicilliopsis zonata CBS 506.65]OJJ51171.1 hypothetical protein ASPZODRAFT_2106358 [Penicilliopsis zonata CBS 506.65]